MSKYLTGQVTPWIRPSGFLVILFFQKAVFDASEIAVADPGFPRGEGANSPGGRQHTILSNFPKNCMKLKELGPLGVHKGCAP